MAQPDNYIGRILNGYQILEKIKDGSVGTVYKATNSRNHLFALKLISEKNSRRSEKVKLFRREAELTKRLNHRHIIKVYEYCNVRPQPFFTMEFFESENLKYSIFYEPKRVYTHEFYILRQVAESLSYIHSIGLTHCDMKPENILVGPNSEVRLIDFSLAKTGWDQFWPWKRRSEGTPLYMAPEQIRGEKVDNRTDIYGFGATLFEVLTRRPPFMATTEQALLKKHLSESVPSMKTYVKTISQGLDELVQKMMAKKPEDRFQDMTSIIYELSKWEKKDTVIRIKQVDQVKPAADQARP